MEHRSSFNEPEEKICFVNGILKTTIHTYSWFAYENRSRKIGAWPEKTFNPKQWQCLDIIGNRPYITSYFLFKRTHLAEIGFSVGFF
jgi:hypothetical protein